MSRLRPHPGRAEHRGNGGWRGACPAQAPPSGVTTASTLMASLCLGRPRERTFDAPPPPFPVPTLIFLLVSPQAETKSFKALIVKDKMEGDDTRGRLLLALRHSQGSSGDRETDGREAPSVLSECPQAWHPGDPVPGGSGPSQLLQGPVQFPLSACTSWSGFEGMAVLIRLGPLNCPEPPARSSSLASHLTPSLPMAALLSTDIRLNRRWSHVAGSQGGHLYEEKAVH